jgi:hypothetical protein
LSSPRLSPQTRLTIPIAKNENANNQAKSSQFQTRFSPFATPANHSNTKLPNSKKTQKSRKIKPIPNEVLSSPHLSTITKKRKNQAKSSQFRTRFCPRHACHPRHPNSKKMRKIKQSQANSERGFRPSLYMKSSNTKRPNSKNKQNQAKSGQGFRPSLHLSSITI